MNTTTEIPGATSAAAPAAAADVTTTSPFRLKTILVPTDFSACSRKALQYALPFAQQQHSTIVLLYAAPIPSYAAAEFGGLDFTRLDGVLRNDGERRLSEFQSQEVPPEISSRCEVRVGAPDGAIVDAAQSLPADLIVISTHGHTGLKHVFLGSVAEHVVRNAPCPVLVVREREHEFLTGSKD
jgi:universal stress protein A